MIAGGGRPPASGSRSAAASALADPARLAARPDDPETLLLRGPAVSKDHVAFVYANDVWVCDIGGHNVRRLTGDRAVDNDTALAFSPDGRALAFSARRDGNTDVYTVPVSGGVVTRLTWHPGEDLVRGWTPDAARLVHLFTRGEQP